MKTVIFNTGNGLHKSQSHTQYLNGVLYYGDWGVTTTVDGKVGFQMLFHVLTFDSNHCSSLKQHCYIYIRPYTYMEPA